MRYAAWVIAVALAAGHAPARSATPATDFSGIWLPDARRAEPWPASLPLAPVARRFMESFDAAARDPTTLCMPFGTPRNMLQTEYPLEIVENTAAPGNGDPAEPGQRGSAAHLARWPRAAPATPEPSWFGTSRGRWEGQTLVIETVGLREDAIVSDNGLPHSGQLRVIERLRVVNDREHGRVLIDDIELHDPQAYTQPLRTRRYYAWAPQARARDSTCVDALWIDKLWRDRLQEHAAGAPQAGVGK